MDDDRVWKFEESLWRASQERYHERVDPECIMALSHAPHLFAGEAAVYLGRSAYVTTTRDRVAYPPEVFEG